MKVVYLASYPRSGNTWLRFLLYNYLWDDLEHSSQVETKIPDLHHFEEHGELIDLAGNDDRFTFLKAHFFYNPDYPYIDHAAGFIYILRNPKDIIKSSIKTFKREKEDVMKDLKHCGLPKPSQRFIGTWTQHVCSWLSAKDKIPGLFIKYEELRNSPEKVLKKIVIFLGLGVDEYRIKQAVQRSLIENMREMEKKEVGDKESIISHKDANFINEGNCYQTLKDISPELEKAYYKEFGLFINIFGYL